MFIITPLVGRIDPYGVKRVKHNEQYNTARCNSWLGTTIDGKSSTYPDVRWNVRPLRFICKCFRLGLNANSWRHSPTHWQPRRQRNLVLFDRTIDWYWHYCSDANRRGRRRIDG